VHRRIPPLESFNAPSQERARSGVVKPAIAAWLIACLVFVASAQAQDGRARCVGQLSSGQVQSLLSRVEGDLLAHQSGARIWFWGWFATYTSIAASSTALALTTDLDPALRDSYWWGAASSGAALLALLLPPLSAISSARHLGAHQPGGERERLLRALAHVEQSAEQQRFLRSGWAQAGNLGVALADGLYLGLRYPDALEIAIPNALASFAVGEAQILTTPRAAVRLQERLERDGAPCLRPSAPTSPVTFRILVSPYSLGAVLRF
jgi:hypothetical protein